MNNENKNVFEETVKTLTQDAMSLQRRFHSLQEKNDFRGALDTMRLLKDTLALIKEYDWELKYSEYKIDGHKEVAVWEQNHSGEIRNRKSWIIEEYYSPYLCWVDLLSYFIKNKQSMLYELSYNTEDEKAHRGTGKTTAIEVLAIKYDLPIFTSKIRADRFNNMIKCRQYSNKTTRAFSSYLEFKDFNSTIILVDEGFKDESILDNLIKNSKHILIGFKRKK